MFYVYILYSKTKDRFYTGYTDDLERRISQHNLGKTPSTKYGIPWEIYWTSHALSKHDALILEKRIKKRGAKRFLQSEAI